MDNSLEDMFVTSHDSGSQRPRFDIRAKMNDLKGVSGPKTVNFKTLTQENFFDTYVPVPNDDPPMRPKPETNVDLEEKDDQ